MTNVAKGKKGLAFAVVALLSAAIAVPSANALYYAQGPAAEASAAKGAMEIVLTVDETATGNGVYSALVMVPNGCTAEEALEVGIISSESQSGLDAIHDYSYQSVKDYLAGQSYTITVYPADSQKVGTHATYDGNGTTGNVQLDRFDRLVVTVTA